MKAFLLFIGSVIIWTGFAQAQDDISEVGSFEVWQGSEIPNSFTSHREAEQHYYSCRQYSDQITAYAASQVLEVQRLAAMLNEIIDSVPDLDPSCKPIQRGELWKPKSESHGTPVILVSSDYNGQSVYIEDAEGNVVDTTLRTNCCANGGRYHAYFRKKCETYPSPVYVRFDGGSCRVINRPCDRIE